MVTIQIDEQTAQGLQHQAQIAGLTVADYLRTLVPTQPPTPRLTWEEMERQFLALSTADASLPADFCRADIYDNHD